MMNGVLILGIGHDDYIQREYYLFSEALFMLFDSSATCGHKCEVNII